MKKIDLEAAAESAADEIKDAVDATREAAEKAAEAAQEGADSLRCRVSRHAEHAAERFGRAMRAGRGRASEVCNTVHGRLSEFGECSTTYIRQKPVQSMLLAALGGVLLAGLIGAVVCRPRDRR